MENGRLVLCVPSERIALARKTHASVARSMFIWFGVVSAVILIAGVSLALNDRASLPGVIVVALGFLVVPWVMAATLRKSLARAMLFVGSDGSTQVVVDDSGIRVADVLLPYERITFVVGTVEGEVYSDGGLRGEAMAYRLDLADERPTLGRAVGVRVGTGARKKLYREGAKSTISLSIGIDCASTIDAPAGMVNQLRTLPHRGEDPGRIDMPFGAFLSNEQLEQLLGTIYQRTQGTRFPIGIVAGALDWASVTTSAAETREEIWRSCDRVITAN